MHLRPTDIQLASFMQGTMCSHWRGYMLDDGALMLIHKDHDVDPTGAMACFVAPDGKVTYGGEREAN